MQETEIDRDYISPDQPISTSGVSPLAKLQETCRNIGNDLHCKAKETTKSSRHAPYKLPHIHSSSQSAPKLTKDKLKKISPSINKTEKVYQAPAVAMPTSLAGPTVPPTSVADYSQYAAAHYQLMRQKLYQKELENIQLSLTCPPAIQPTFPRTDPLAVSPTPTNPLDYSKLAAFFCNKLEQTTPTPNPLTTATEALQTYRKLLETAGSHLIPPLFQEPKLSPPPQLHECQWKTSSGICGKKHYSYEDLMLHLRSHASAPAETVNLGLPPLNTNLHGLTSNLLSPELQFAAAVDAAKNSHFSSSFSNFNGIGNHPYSLPARQISVPFLR